MHASIKFFFIFICHQPFFSRQWNWRHRSIAARRNQPKSYCFKKPRETTSDCTLPQKRVWYKHQQHYFPDRQHYLSFCLFLGCCFGRTGVLCRGSSVLSWTEAADRRLWPSAFRGQTDSASMQPHSESTGSTPDSIASKAPISREILENCWWQMHLTRLVWRW